MIFKNMLTLYGVGFKYRLMSWRNVLSDARTFSLISAKVGITSEILNNNSSTNQNSFHI